MTTENLIIQCKNCGTKNRVPRSRIHDRPVCGKCRMPLPAMRSTSSPVIVTDQTFQSEVLNFSGTVLLDCWAPWCGPCKMVAPILDQLAKSYAGRAKIAKLNVDQNPGISSRYQILSIPTMLFFKNGQMVKTLTGAHPQPEIERQLRAVMKGQRA
jgi:thioredoxin 2